MYLFELVLFSSGKYPEVKLLYHMVVLFSIFFFKFFFWLHCTACGILVPRPGIEPGPSSMRVQSPNHWTAREFPERHAFLTAGSSKLLNARVTCATIVASFLFHTPGFCVQSFQSAVIFVLIFGHAVNQFLTQSVTRTPRARMS